MAKVAIIIRSKDRLPFLARALADIAAQTFTDWQALVINDGGDAAGVDALLAAQPPALQEKIAVLHLSQNLGRSGSAQKGLDASDGEYFALHDDDDTWHPAFLARTTAWLEAHPEAAAVAVRTEILHEANAVASPSRRKSTTCRCLNCWSSTKPCPSAAFTAVRTSVPSAGTTPNCPSSKTGTCTCA